MDAWNHDTVKICAYGFFPTSLLLHFGAIIKNNKGHLNSNSAIPWQLIWWPRQLLSDSQVWGVVHTGRIWWTKGWVTSWVGWRGTPRDFITLLRMACGLKFMNCFWNFPSNIFRPWLQITETTESETADDRDDCILNVNYNFKILAFYLKF